MGQTTSDICSRSVTKCQRTSQVCYGVVQMVKENHRFLTEWYKGSNNIRSLLGSGAKGQTTSDVCYGVV